MLCPRCRSADRDPLLPSDDHRTAGASRRFWRSWGNHPAGGSTSSSVFKPLGIEHRHLVQRLQVAGVALREPGNTVDRSAGTGRSVSESLDRLDQPQIPDRDGDRQGAPAARFDDDALALATRLTFSPNCRRAAVASTTSPMRFSTREVVGDGGDRRRRLPVTPNPRALAAGSAAGCVAACRPRPPGAAGGSAWHLKRLAAAGEAAAAACVGHRRWVWTRPARRSHDLGARVPATPPDGGRPRGRLIATRHVARRVARRCR